MIGGPSSQPGIAAASPAARNRWKGWRLLAPALVVLAVLWLWRLQIAGEVLHVGNHDRLLFGLTHELVNYDSREAVGHDARWDEIAFGGVNHGALPSVGENLSVLKLIMPWVTRANLYQVAGFIPLALMLMAAASAYLALRAAVQPAAAATGAILYVCSVFAQLNFSQIDMAAILLVSLPFGAWLIFFRPPGRTTALLLILTALPVAYLGFSPQSWYLIGFWILLALHRGLLERNWAPLQQLGGALLASFSLCLPRLWVVLSELQSYQRGSEGMGAVVSFDQLQRFFNVTPREIFRWLDDGLFGRFPAESTLFNNNLNMNEGFQIYSSTFATLLGLVVIVRHRGRWFGALDPRSGWIASCAWTLVVVVLVTFVSPVTRAVHHLFFSAPLLHARISLIGLLPAAALAAAGIHQWLDTSSLEHARRSRACLVGALLIGILGSWALTLIVRNGDPAIAIAANRPLPSLIRAALTTFVHPADGPVQPRRVVVQRPEAGLLEITWEADGPVGRTFAIEMRRGEGTFGEIGQTAGTHYRVGDTATDDLYAFRIRTIQGGRASAYSDEAQVGPGEVSGVSLITEPAPALLLNGQRLARILVCTVLFLSLLLLVVVGRNALLRASAGAILAVLMVTQALGDADLRANGPQTASFPIPFKGDNLFNTPPDTLRPPTAAQQGELHRLLEPERWRTVFLAPEGYSGFAAPHVAAFWQLRTVEGYLSGVPSRIRALPWPDAAIGLRTLAFAREDALPWDLLARLNVRQVVRIDDALYYNLPRTSLLAVIPNPVSPLPREFFVARTRLAESEASADTGLPADPRLTSWVEGEASAGEWSAEGTIEAVYRGDLVEIRVDNSVHDRFLVLNEAYHPGWTAVTVDGRALSVVPVNTFMRGLVLPAGTSGVRLTFATGPGRWARWSSILLFLALTAGLSAWSRRWPESQTS